MISNFIQDVVYLIDMEYIFIFIIFIYSVIIHEISHGAVALRLGDSTAKVQGRLTLNPLPHIDPIGSILLPLLLFLSGSGIIFGWAKPVPVNPYNFTDKKYGELKVAFAGPASNLCVALVFGLLLRFLGPDLPLEMIRMFSFIVIINIQLAVFNLIPIPPLDGSHILFSFFPRQFEKMQTFLYQYGFFILLFIMFFLSPVIIRIASFIFFLITGYYP
ncbi:MAG: site-2 protease family protein [Candidatus Nealsonbacteria bacterium]|nr:site-2 protease family protein [Candidatus Nealsonbacteria bacterium]